jgi:hypothetical protein
VSAEEKNELVYGEWSNAQLLAAVITRLSHQGPSYENAQAAVHIRTALLWMGTPKEKLP